MDSSVMANMDYIIRTLSLPLYLLILDIYRKLANVHALIQISVTFLIMERKRRNRQKARERSNGGGGP